MEVRSKALVAAFGALDYGTVNAVINDGLRGPLVDIVKSTRILPIEALQAVTE